jgi:hypothetical protein
MVREGQNPRPPQLKLSPLTARTSKHCKASRQDAASDTAIELVIHERRQGRSEALLDGRVQREQVFAHHLMKRGGFGRRRAAIAKSAVHFALVGTPNEAR